MCTWFYICILTNTQHYTNGFTSSGVVTVNKFTVIININIYFKILNVNYRKYKTVDIVGKLGSHNVCLHANF